MRFFISFIKTEKMYNAEIITIGDEILIGQIVDTNSAWLAQQLNSIGINVAQITSISDSKEHIIKSLNQAKERADIIIITGGLGPTRDDITKHTLSEYFNSELIMHKETLDHIAELFGRLGLESNSLNRNQALLPEGCTLLQNSVGTAAGMIFYEKNKIFVSMPGVPLEMKPMTETHLIPYLKDRYSGSSIFHKTIVILNHGESQLAQKLSNFEDDLNKRISLAYLPAPGRIRLRFSVHGPDREEMELIVNAEIEKVKRIIPNDISSYEAEQLEETLANLLKRNEASLSTAESCTGGNIAHKITSVPGSSEYFKGSIVSYANEIKTNILGVKQKDLDNYGAVSEQVVIQMAEGVRQKLNTVYSLATSGIAGPDGGTDDKPVGTVWFALATPKETITKKAKFGKNRSYNIEKSSVVALNMLREYLLKV